MTQIFAAGSPGARRSEEADAGSFCVPDAQPDAQPDAHGHCITCGDEALPARVLHVDALGRTARVEVNGQQTEVDISLMETITPGQVLLVHGGVALGRMDVG